MDDRINGWSYGAVRRRLQRFCGILCLAFLAPAAAVSAETPARDAAASERPFRLVAFGDSLTAGYGLPESAAFPTVLQKALTGRGHAVEIANAGVSGDTTSGGLARLDWSVPEGTDGVIVELGANDMLRGVDPAIPRRALEAIVSRLKARGIEVMLAGMLASPALGPEYGRVFDAIHRDLATKYDLVLYPFFLDGVADGPLAYALPDRLHPSAEGVKVIVERILPSVEAFLGRLAAKPRG